MQKLKVLPYSPSYVESTFKRVLVKPIPKESYINDAGLLIPTDVGRICEKGIVYGVCDGSEIKVGDTVLYKKLDRSNPEHVDIIALDNEMYDVLYENELWSVNEQPFNKIFVAPTSDFEVNEAGLILPNNVKGITQKGIVFRSYIDYAVNPGDKIEYRRVEQTIFPTIEIEGIVYDVLNETDVFIINGKVSPHRIIIRIDMLAQQNKQTQTDSGLLLSQLFLHMLYNLQYGEILEIGEEAQKLYPEFKVGDTAIIHHSVEDGSQNYRIVGQEVSKFNVLRYEHRIINAWDTSNREILGRIANRDKMIILPYGNHEFFHWDLDLLAKSNQSDSLIVDFETNIDQCHTLDDLINTIGHKAKEYIKKAQAKMRGKKEVLAQTDPNTSRDLFDQLKTEFEEAERDALRISMYLKANHLVVCKRVETGERVVLTYKELYPISILGKKFLIGWKDFVVAKLIAE